jgi:murein DD-endopeptidase MepM/ murein hydrolase activator NlpD
MPSAPKRVGRFLVPVKGSIISGYGPKDGGLHNDGINIAAREGAPIRAAENGVVVYTGNELRGYGNLLLIRHSGGWVTAYAHTSKFLVKPGARVKQGEVVAEVGRTGNVDRPQLHFELRKGTRAVNPQSLI